MVEYLTNIIDTAFNLMKKLLSCGLALLAFFVALGTVASVPVQTVSASTPTISIVANPASVVQGTASTLQWNFNGEGNTSTFCQASGNNGTDGAHFSGGPIGGGTSSSDFSTGNLGNVGTYTYTIVCYSSINGPQVAAAQATVTVTPRPVTFPSMTITASPASVSYNMGSTISWTVNNGGDANATCSVDGVNGASFPSGTGGSVPATSGSLSTGPLMHTSEYQITCTNSFATQYAYTTVGVAPATYTLPTVSLSASPTSISPASLNPSAASTLTWDISGGGDPTATCTLYNSNYGNGDGEKFYPYEFGSGSGTTGAINAATTWTMSCTNSVGTESATATVTTDSTLPHPYLLHLNLTASPTTVNYGGSSTLTWTTSGASVPADTICYPSSALSTNAGSNWDTASLLSNGTFSTGPLYTTATYYMMCSSDGAGTAGSATITVTPQGTTSGIVAPKVTLTATPTLVDSGSSSALQWTVNNGGDSSTTCTAGSGWSGSPSAAGGTQSTGSITATTVYTLTCTNSAGQGSAQATVGVDNPQTVQPTNAPIIENFIANPTTINYGSASTLTWTIDNGGADYSSTSCVGTGGWSGPFSAVGGYWSTGPLTATASYTLTCTNPAGSATASVTVIVNPQSASGNNIVASPSTIYTTPTVHLTATPTSVSYGMGSTLTWAVSNGGDPSTSCNGTGGWNGSLSATGASWSTGALTTTTTYTLTCTNTAGQNSANVTVTVAPQTIQSNVITATPQSSTYALPTATIHATPLSVMAGQSSTLTWTVNTGGDSGTTCTLSDSNNNSAQVSAGTSQSTTGPLSTTTTYTFDCTNSAGQGYPVSATVVVVGTAAAATPVITPTTSATASGTSTSTATSSSCLNFTENFGRGSLDASTNGDVTLLQNFLASEGYFTQASTGYYGSITQAAVSAFQIKNGIKPVSGYVGPLTRAAIKGETCGG